MLEDDTFDFVDFGEEDQEVISIDLGWNWRGWILENCLLYMAVF